MTTIDTRLGKIEGKTDGDVTRFLGIPYALPPLGDRRFRSPEARGPWEGTRNATRYPPRAFGMPLPEHLMPPEMQPESEDCLFVNVVTPAADGKARPVLFWIHGGSFIAGSGNDFDGSVLAAQGDVVVVTVSYRLGPLGFLDLSQHDPTLAGSASNGFRDQVLALEWVRDNIADYGGDPGNVTIFGTSAGGSSVNAMTAIPAADGLYHKIICHSGGALSMPPSPYAAAFAAHLGVAEEGLVEHLRALSGEAMFEAWAELGVEFPGAVDGMVVVRDSDSGIAAAAQRGVPYIAGWNHDEGTLFTLDMPPEYLEPMAEMMAGMVTDGADPAAYLAAIAAAHPDEGTKERTERIVVELFESVATRSAEAASAADAGAWVYRFDLPSTGFDGTLGATHASEVAFTFNRFDGRTGFLAHDGDDPVVRQLAEKWSNTVIAFARTGDPNGAGLPPWPRYTPKDRRVMILDGESHVESDPGGDARKRRVELLENASR